MVRLDDMAEPESTDTRMILARATLARVKTGVEEGQMPVITQIIRIIREISEKAESMSVQDLAEIISQDPSTMTRILSIACTLGYNPSGAEISSIPQAIALVGFERIRNLSISVLLLENVERQCSVETNRELAGLALSSGLLASSLCARNHEAEPDLAFLCGALRGYGRMLMATFLAEDYAEVNSSGASEGSPTDEEFREKFGLTPLELANGLLSGMQMPQMILRTLQEIPQSTRERLSEAPSSGLMLAADLGLRMADLLATKPLTPDDFEIQLSQLTRGYAESFQLTANEAGNLLKDVASRITTFRECGKYGEGRVTLFKRLQCLSEGVMPPPPFKPKSRKPPGTVAVAARGRSAEAAAPRVSQIDATREEVMRRLAEPVPDVDLVLQLVLKTLQVALDLESCLIFIRDASGATFKLATGLGPMVAEIGNCLSIKTAQRDVFGVPLMRGEDVVIQNPDDPRMRTIVPEWLRKPGHALPFALLPLKDAQGPFGLICGICRNSAALSLVNQANEELRQLRAKLSELGPLLRGRQQL